MTSHHTDHHIDRAANGAPDFVAYDPPLMGPPDLTGPQAAQRAARLNELGLIRVDPQWDAFAHEAAEAARKLIGISEPPVTMVNFVTDKRQFFAGQYVPQTRVPNSPIAASLGSDRQVPREMPLDYGGCPHVVAEGKARVLDDICAWRGFWGNPVVDAFGVRSYMGAPVSDSSGQILGTVCIIYPDVLPWVRRGGFHFIKARAAELSTLIRERE